MSLPKNSSNPIIELAFAVAAIGGGLLQVQAIGLPGAAELIANPNAGQVACKLVRQPAAPLYGLSGLASLGMGALAVKRLQLALGANEEKQPTANPVNAIAPGQQPEIQIPVSGLGKQPEAMPINQPGEMAVEGAMSQQPVAPTPQPRNVVSSIAKSRNCLMLVAAPGSGKTTLVCAVQHELFAMAPEATWISVVQKAEKSSFGGIKENCPGGVLVATNENNVWNPYFGSNPTKPGIINIIDAVYAEFERRSRMEDEQEMKNLPPLVLYLGDYPSLVSILGGYMSESPEDFSTDPDTEKSPWQYSKFRKALVQKAFDKLFLMVTNARATGVRVLFDGQDFNVGSLSPNGIRLNISKNLRECMGAIGLGLISTNSTTGEQEGSYGVLDNFMGAQNSPLSQRDRDVLGAEYPRMKTASMAHQRPLCCTTAGGAAEMSLLPDLRGIAERQLPAYVLASHAERVKRLLEGKSLVKANSSQKGAHIPRRDELMSAIASGKNQADSIQVVYGVSAGGSPQYRQYANYYNQLKAEMGVK